VRKGEGLLLFRQLQNTPEELPFLQIFRYPVANFSRVGNPRKKGFEWLGHWTREYELLSFGQGSVLLRATNDKDSVRSSSAFAKTHPDNFEALAGRCKPGLEALRDLGFSMPENLGTPMLNSLVHLVASMRALGADIDPSNRFTRMLLCAPDARQTRDPQAAACITGGARYSGPKKLDHDFESNPW
jgi:hypothetical protein